MEPNIEEMKLQAENIELKKQLIIANSRLMQAEFSELEKQANNLKAVIEAAQSLSSEFEIVAPGPEIVAPGPVD